MDVKIDTEKQGGISKARLLTFFLVEGVGIIFSWYSIHRGYIGTPPCDPYRFNCIGISPGVGIIVFIFYSLVAAQSLILHVTHEPDNEKRSIFFQKISGWSVLLLIILFFWWVGLF